VNAQDLGQAQGEDVVEEERAAERVALVRTQTEASGVGQESNVSTKDGIDYNLINCIFIVLKEQGHLWKCFILLGIATIVGGKQTALKLHCLSLTLL
jgi:ATP-binding cassette subfamily B (MDR/TAP) protein 1